MLGVAVLLGLSGCTSPPTVPVDTPSSPVAASSSAPPSVAASQEFTFDDIARFDDGLEVEIAGTEANTTDQGATSSGGDIVIASVRIENKTEAAYDPVDLKVSASYAGGTPAPMVIQKAKGLTGTFPGVIEVGDEGVAAVAFAVPSAEQKKITILVDPNDEEHDPVSFTGEIQPS